MGSSASDKTMMWRGRPEDGNPGNVLRQVHIALSEKGYSPIDQIVGYLLSGDPSYITSHNGARNLIRQLERDEILEELVRAYLQREPAIR